MSSAKHIFPHEIVSYTAEHHLQQYHTRSRLIYLVVLIFVVISFISLYFIKVDVSVSSTGIIRAVNERSAIRMPVEGRIDSLFVHENMHVQAGQTLLKIRSRIVDEQTLLLSTQQTELQQQLQDLQRLMDLERESQENKTALTPEMAGDIVFRDVHFRYGSRTNVFEGLNLHIPQGKITAIVGESGSGKTTLLSLLQNIYPLQSGNILIGDYDIRYLSHDSLRQYVSVVPQQIHLFAGSVIENIALGEFEPDIKKVIRICQELDILSFIEKLPNGFNTYLGENGATLSGGQRQRIAIARALYKEPSILILDGATSSLDSNSERYIQQAVAGLRDQHKTVLLIAHRLSTVMQADKIVVMQQGKVVEEGTHEELLEHPGQYFAMWEQQFPMIRQLSPRLPARKKVQPDS